VENPHNYEIYEAKAELLTTLLADVDIAVINGNYAIDAGLKVSGALAVESAEGAAVAYYQNIIAVKEGNEKSAKIQALIKALKSEAVKSFIQTKYEGAVVPLF
jgi:D-methionine transport system substrate-binding protein